MAEVMASTPALLMSMLPPPPGRMVGGVPVGGAGVSVSLNPTLKVRLFFCDDAPRMVSSTPKSMVSLPSSSMYFAGS